MAGQVWATNSLGGFLYSLNLSDELREALQPMERFRQFCDAREAAGKNKGNTFTWDIVNNVSNQGGTLVETSTMPETNFTIAQATLTVNEWGQAVPYTGKLEALSKFDVRKPVMQALRNDANKALDAGAYAQFYLSKLRVVGTNTSTVTLTTNGTATLTNSVAYGTGHAKSIVDLMKERNIPSYQGDDYMALGWPTSFRGLKNSLETLHQYTERGIALVFNGEIGRYENARYVEQTNVSKGITTTGFSGTAWTNTLSDWIFFMGEDTVTEGVTIPLEMRAKIPGDYGRSKGVAWYALEGFGLIHTQAAETRIVMWDSAA
jgi:hypothetical protein